MIAEAAPGLIDSVSIFAEYDDGEDGSYRRSLLIFWLQPPEFLGDEPVNAGGLGVRAAGFAEAVHPWLLRVGLTAKLLGEGGSDQLPRRDALFCGGGFGLAEERIRNLEGSFHGLAQMPHIYGK